MINKKVVKKIALWILSIVLVVSNITFCCSYNLEESIETLESIENVESSSDAIEETESEIETDKETESDIETDEETTEEIETETEIEAEEEIEPESETEIETEEEIESESESEDETAIETETEPEIATESTIEEAAEGVLDESMLSTSLFSAGPGSVYWYLKNSDTELHLSGTLPTDPAYAPGQDDYYGVLPGSAATTVTKVVIDNEIHPIYCSSWFSGFTNLDNIENIHWINTSDVIDMSYMFFGCAALTSLDLSTFDTQNVTDMNFMFYYCTNLSDLNVSNFNTEKVTKMENMFSLCSSLVTLDISSFDTSSLTSAQVMFADASSLNRIYASPLFSISAPVSSQMFNGCLSLEGENGTRYDTALVDDGSYACIDTASTPGYFTRKQVTVSYNTNGGSSIADSTAYSGYTISIPTTPSKSGYTFDNWYKEPSFSHVWNFASDVVRGNTILYARWTSNSSGGGSSGGGGSGGGSGGGGGGGGTPMIDENGMITPSGTNRIGLEGLNSGNLKYCTFYKWDYDGSMAKDTNISYDLNDYRFYNYDLTVVSNKWVGFSYFGGKIIWYYTKTDGSVNKDVFIQIDNHIYYFDGNGKMVTGYAEAEGKNCYFDERDGIEEGRLIYFK